jgi:hypothetical protein
MDEFIFVGNAAANSCPYPLSLRDISLYYRESPGVPQRQTTKMIFIIVYPNIMVNPQLFVYWQLTGNGTPRAAFPTIGLC